MEAKPEEPTPVVEPVKKEKKPRTEAQLKAFEVAKEKLKANQEARKFSREQEAKKAQDELKKVEEEAKKAIAPQVEVKPMERKKPKPKKLEVVIPAEVEKAVEEATAPKKPSAPRAKPQPPQEYPAPAPAKPVYSNPYMDMIQARMRR